MSQGNLGNFSRVSLVNVLDARDNRGHAENGNIITLKSLLMSGREGTNTLDYKEARRVIV